MLFIDKLHQPSTVSPSSHYLDAPTPPQFLTVMEKDNKQIIKAK